MWDFCSSARSWICTPCIGRQVLTSGPPGKSSNLFNLGICLLRSCSLRPRVPPGPNIWSRNSTKQKFLFYILRYWENSDLHMSAHLWAKLLQSYPTLWDPTDYSPPASSVHGILEARTLEWVVTPFSRGSSWPRDQTLISYISCIGRWMFPITEPPGKPLLLVIYFKHNSGLMISLCHFLLSMVSLLFKQF